MPEANHVDLEESSDVLGAPFMGMEEWPWKVEGPFDKDADKLHEVEIG